MQRASATSGARMVARRESVRKWWFMGVEVWAVRPRAPAERGGYRPGVVRALFFAHERTPDLKMKNRRGALAKLSGLGRMKTGV